MPISSRSSTTRSWPRWISCRNASPQLTKDTMSKKHENGKLDRKTYEKELLRLQEELSHLQSWVKQTGERIIIVLEGRDAAGKGGTIKAITERVSPRVF